VVVGTGGGRRLQDPCALPGQVSYESTTTYHLRFCVDCPPACKARNQAKLSAYFALHADDSNWQGDVDALLSAGLCLQDSEKVSEVGAAAYNNGICDDNCNNLDCAHDMSDCSYDDIYELCVKEQSGTRTWTTAPSVAANSTSHSCDLPTSEAWACPSYEETEAYTAIFDSLSASSTDTSSQLVEVVLQASFLEPMSLKFQSTDASMIVTANIQYRVQWSDERLAVVPCRKMLSYYMGIDSSHGDADKAVAETVKSLQWIPEITINGENSTTDTASFYFSESMPWLDDNDKLPTQDANALCHNCAVYMASETVTFTVTESEFGSFQYFPFDSHSLRIQVAMQDTARFVNCEKAHRDATSGWTRYLSSTTLADWQVLLLPSTNDWIMRGAADDIEFRTVGKSLNACEMELHISRNPFVFLIKQILVTIFFVLCGLLALLLAPTDLMGDRVTTILFSALIVSTNMQGDIGLGNPQYIIWYDYFNLVQFLILLVVLIESIYVHKLVLWHRTRTAYRLDRTCLISITLLYLLVLVVLFIIPFSGSGAVAVGAVLAPLLFTGSFLVFTALRRRETRVRQAALAQLRVVPMSDVDAFREALRHGFAAFDYDENESLDIDQLRNFLIAVYPHATKRELTKCLMALRPIFAEDETISFEGFETAFETYILPLLGSPDQAPSRRSLVKSRTSNARSSTAVQPIQE